MSEPDLHPEQTARDVETLAHGALTTLIGRVTGRAINYVVVIVIGRLLGPAQYGLYGIGLTIMALGGLAATLGLEHGVIRYGMRYRRSDPERLKGVIFEALGVTVVVGALAGALLFALAPWIAGEFFDKPDLAPVLKGFSLGILFYPVLRVAASSTRITQRMRYYVLSEELSAPASFIVLFFLLYALGWGLMAAVIGNVASTGVAAAIAMVLLVRLFPALHEGARPVYMPLRELISFSVPTAASGMMALIAMWLDRLMVGYYLTEAETGVYLASSQISFLFTILLISFNSIFSPMIADLYHHGQSRRLDELFKVSTRWGFYLGVPVFLVIALVPERLLTFIFDARYAHGAWPMVILSIGQMANLATGAVGFLLVMSGREKRWMLASGVALGANFVLNLLLIPRLGLEGAAVATAITVCGLFTVGLFLVRRSMGLWPYDRRLLKGGIAIAATAGVLVWARRWDLGNELANILTLCTLSVVVFFGSLRALGLPPEDHDLLVLLRKRLRRR